MKSRYCLAGILGLLGSLSVSLPQTVSAQVTAAPSLLNFQGRLTKPDGTPVADGTYSIRFSLHDALTSGTEKWNQTIGTVAVRNGVFAVLLNTNTADLFSGNLYLEIKVGTDAPLAPRQQLVSVAYAMKANTVPDGSITSSKLASDALNNISWLLGGNAGTTPASNFVGTKDNQPLVFRTNNTEKMRLLANGNLGIGTNNPSMSLEITTPSLYSAPALGAAFSASRWGYLHVGSTDHSLIWNTGSAMRFGTESSKGTGYAELARITPEGRLAIGTPTATSPLTFRNADERKITFWETADNNNKFYGIDMAGGGRVRHWTGVFGSFEVGNYNVADDTFINRFRVTNSGLVNIYGNSALEFGTNISGKEANAGKIGYQTFTSNALDIVGAGTTGLNRKIKFWNEGGADFNGPIALTAGTKDMVNIASSSAVGTWLNLTNTSTGGRTWSLISAGSGNGEGAGTLVFNTQGVTAAQLKSTGEFIAPIITVTGGSDVAEPYHVANAGEIKAAPGMVVCIDGAKVGQMKVAAKLYDKTVAGIISGANGINPGITLRQKGTVADGELPVASIGRVWCWCDADANGPIEAGDMLTTSNTPGHAMKVTDFNQANGAVIGKAMSNLKTGKGLVLVLVSLK